MFEFYEDAPYYRPTNPDELFANAEQPEIGQRLGISFVRSQQEEMTMKIGERDFPVSQCGMGMIAISAVVWDAALLLVDFLYSEIVSKSTRILKDVCPESPAQGHTLELGCGTGVCGIASCILGASSCTFSDLILHDTLLANLCHIPSSTTTKLIQHDWQSLAIPEGLLRPPHYTNNDAKLCWDTIICSDVLYEVKAQQALLSLLKNIQFNKLIISYKRRTDAPEKAFIEQLAEWCTIYVVRGSAVPPVNLSQAALSGLFIIVATPTHNERDIPGES